jgi:hypothetical protein
MSTPQDRPAGYGAGTGSYAEGTPPQAAGAHRQTAAYSEPEYPQGYDSGGGAATGFTALAATLMVLSGLWSFFVGITGVLSQAFYLRVPNFTFSYSVHAWGWTHLVIGAIVFAAGVCLFLGMLWARIVGVVLAVISGIANFLFLPHYPIWSIIVIALDVIIIWALTVGSSRRRATY